MGSSISNIVVFLFFDIVRFLIAIGALYIPIATICGKIISFFIISVLLHHFNGHSIAGKLFYRHIHVTHFTGIDPELLGLGNDLIAAAEKKAAEFEAAEKKKATTFVPRTKGYTPFEELGSLFSQEEQQ